MDKTRGIRLIVDESFIDFSCGMPDNTLLKDGILEEYPHLAVVKAFPNPTAFRASAWVFWPPQTGNWRHG